MSRPRRWSFTPTVSSTSQEIWTAFHFAKEYASHEAKGTEENGIFAIEYQDLDVTIAKSGQLTANAVISLRTTTDGVAVLPFDLYPTLRISKITDSTGKPLDFVQENKDEDPGVAVILPAALKKGESYKLTFSYSGKDAVRNEGGANYYPVPGARESWYPAIHFGKYANYHMVFHTPKELELIATGKKLNSKTEGGQTITEWKSEAPLPVAGFNLGRFKKEETKLNDGFIIDAYANTDPSNMVSNILQANDGVFHQIGQMGAAPSAAIGNLNTTGMLKPMLNDAAVSTNLYTNYFGKLPFQELSVTQQGACNFGQSWPTLVYLPVCAFWDGTIKDQLGLDAASSYWKVVTPHEVAHQWWGQTVSFNSYRDQWMSEGFADMSASLFLQSTRKNNSEFLDFWKEQRRLLIEKNAVGNRPIDVGPLTMGYRLDNEKSGSNIYRALIYPKGAYVLHMLRMMMWNAKEGDKNFIEMMKDFVQTYRSKPASTEDFKTMVEKHMTPMMNVNRDNSMDWFFREYVYGTSLPTYNMQSTIKSSEAGTAIHFKLTQSGVDENFVMLVPLYLVMEDGRTMKLGAVSIRGNSTVENDINLNLPGAKAKKLAVNQYYDVLSIDIQ